MPYSYNFNYINLRDLNELEFYLNNNQIDILYSNYTGQDLILTFSTEKSQNEINNISSLLLSYPNTLKQNTGDNFISIKNSTETVLSSYGIFSGEYENVSEYNSISIFCISNTQSLSEGFEMHYSLDGIISSFIEKYSITYDKAFIKTFPVSTKFIKIVYKNDTIPQNFFKLNVMYFKTNSQFINELTIKEESPSGPSTSGKFRIHGFEINAEPNTYNIKDFSWKYPISALKIKFMTTVQNIGDILNVFIIPAINIAKLETQSSIGDTVLNISSEYIQNISVGYFIFISDGNNTQDLGLVISKNTETNQITVQNPLIKNFKDNANISWQVPVGVITNSIGPGQHNILTSESVIKKLSPGVNLKIFNGSVLHEFGEITQINIQNNSLEIENTPTTTFNTNSLLFAYINNVKNMKLIKDDNYEIGGSKIGGSYLTSFYIVRLVYTNTKNENVNFCWQTEYLY